jgi:hypothetical protein
MVFNIGSRGEVLVVGVPILRGEKIISNFSCGVTAFGILFNLIFLLL